jgi:hypothetical protein
MSMPEPAKSKLDYRLDQLSKLSGVLLPIVVALVGGLYTYVKDRSDSRTLQQEQRRELQQTQYNNLTALIPLLTSQDPSSRLLGMEIFTSEAKKREAPLDLVPSIKRLGSEHADAQPQAMAAVAAAEAQQKAQQNTQQ